MVIIASARRDPRIGSAFRCAREAARLSLSEIATGLDIDSSEVLLLESDLAEPTVSLFSTFADLVGQPLDALLGDSPTITSMRALEEKVLLMEQMSQAS
jgi:transcriptional regulator with XRE-family HTH domain